ncbi:hypothetical protein [Aliarcobacter butzleri]|uniref:hypothetical protein n=1 Tax=Aliarcobacter butzleri TaxID=28197 RepID=UPI0005A08532|nr:hypothetical protein [Aliarcobacter butzleri]
MKRKTVFYLEANLLSEIYRQGILKDYTSIGFTMDNRKIILSQILYKRKKIKQRPYSLFVDSKSYQKEREKLIDYLIEEEIIKRLQKGDKSSTILNFLRKIFSFINWADKEDIDFYQNINVSRIAYEKYTMYLREKIRKNELKQRSASSYHFASIKFLRELNLDTEGYISAGIKSIPYIFELNNTKKNIEEDISYAFKTYTLFFEQVTDFLLEKKLYPLKVNLLNDTLWITPNSKRFLHLKSDDSSKLITFNNKTGKVRTVEEMSNLTLSPIKTIKRSIKTFCEEINKNNSDFYSEQRLKLGALALKAYFLHFRMITGMNDSTAATLFFNEDYEISKSTYFFRNIKYRARNKLVEFQIRKEMVNYFKKFIKLRRFILNGNEMDYLFFLDYGEKVRITSFQFKGSFGGDSCQQFIKKIDPKIPIITARQDRVNKMYYIINKHGAVTASKLGQSSLYNIINNYHGETEESYTSEITNYFNKLNESLISRKNDKVENINSGQCREFGVPDNKIVINDAIKIDCKSAEGCLFCSKYCNHADEMDIRKLISLLYVINESKYISKNEEYYLFIFSDVINRIEEILKVIKTVLKEKSHIVEDIRVDVFENENLTPYWEQKLNMLVKIGVLK